MKNQNLILDFHGEISVMIARRVISRIVEDLSKAYSSTYNAINYFSRLRISIGFYYSKICFNKR